MSNLVFGLYSENRAMAVAASKALNQRYHEEGSKAANSDHK